MIEKLKETEDFDIPKELSDEVDKFFNGFDKISDYDERIKFINKWNNDHAVTTQDVQNMLDKCSKVLDKVGIRRKIIVIENFINCLKEKNKEK